MAPVQEELYRFPSVLTVIHRPFVHIHAHKLICLLGIETTSELMSISQSLLPMRESIANALLNQSRDSVNLLHSQISPDHIASQWQRQFRRLHPPLSQVQNLVQTINSIGQLSLMNDQSRINFSALNRGNDLIKRNDLVLKVRLKQFEGQKSGCPLAGNSNEALRELVSWKRTAADQNRPISLAHTGSAAEQRIALLKVSIRMDANSCHLIPACQGSFVQCLDIRQLVSELKLSCIYLPLAQSIEHKGVIAVRAMGYADCLFGHRFRSDSALLTIVIMMKGDSILIETHAVEPFFKNGYIVSCSETLQGIYIDPGEEASQLLQRVEEMSVQLVAIVNTHAHIDHISGVGLVKEKWDVPIYLHPEDETIYKSLPIQAERFGLQYPPAPPIDRFLEEGQELQVGSLRLKVHHTPGHSPGSVSLEVEEHVFCGDVIFAGSIGRTDLPGGSYETLMESIHRKVLPLGDEKLLYPGHGPETTIGRERETNPFLTT